MRPLRLAAVAVILLVAACKPHVFETKQGGGDGAAAPAAVGSELEHAITFHLPDDGGRQTTDLAEAMAALRVPAVSVALIEDGELAWTQAWGDANPQTPFQAASMSKPLAAVTALSLVEEGFLTLDDDIGRWIPSWGVDIPGHPVTLRGLLSMTAGANVPGFEGYAPGAPLPTLQLILAGAPPANSPPIQIKTKPGKRYAYSGGGYEIAEAAMQGSSGVDFGELARALVLVPSGMAASAFEMPPGDTISVIAARGHDSAGEPLPGGWRIFPERAAAGLWSTPGDLARFLIEVDRSLEGNSELLNEATARFLIEAQAPGPYSLGFHVVGEGDELALHKRGQNVGYQGYMVLFPATGQGAVVMTGSDNGNLLAEGILQRLGELHDWPWDGELAD